MFSALKRHLELLRKNPTAAASPGAISALERAADNSFPGAFHALHCPIAPDTTEVTAVLGSASTRSLRVIADWSEPIEIVGFMPHIWDYEDGPPTTLPSATTEDVIVSLETDQRLRRTQAKGVGVTGNDVALTALGVRTRLMALRLDSSAPRLTFEFGWRLGPMKRKSSLIAVSIFYRRIA